VAKKKLLLIVGSVFMLLIFIAIMGSGFILKEPLTSNDEVIKHLKLVEQSAEKSQWSEASTQLKAGNKAWEKVKNRIQFSVERDFIEKIDAELATLQGAVKAEDQQEIIILVEKIKIIWDELGQ